MSNKPFQIVDQTHPVYRGRPHEQLDLGDFTSHVTHIDLTKIALPPFGDSYTVAEAAKRFDQRAAATVSTAAGFENDINMGPTSFAEGDLLEEHFTGNDKMLNPTAKCLALLAFYDYFPKMLEKKDLRSMVSDAILRSQPGWCGTFGPGSINTISQIEGAIHDGLEKVINLFQKIEEGNYDMSQMHLLQIAYRYYDALSPEAQERLIRVLLATGRIHRANVDDLVTSGGVPIDYTRAGFLDFPIPLIGHVGIHPKAKRIGETENHILTIHTARYLTNQLLYQRDPTLNHDNRRNGPMDAISPQDHSCMHVMLDLLRNMLRDDFSEYNAKNYQTEARSALLNLCSYSYDHEVRLAAQMVLDYISAHIAVSSNDLRRMVPFRRRNEDPHSARNNSFMEVGLIEADTGADPMVQHFSVIAGNTRAYSTGIVDRPINCINTKGKNGSDSVGDVLSDYRIPPSIHDLFMNDSHRRFFQRLHRVPLDNEEETGRNCENYEIYASSPSYLITAGGSPATYAIDPHILGFVIPGQDQQLGVAVTTSFMPTGTTAGRGVPGEPDNRQNSAKDLIQFGSFSQEPNEVFNYGVAPDFVCGHRMYYPPWCPKPDDTIADDRHGKFHFVNRGLDDKGPGFFLAIYDDGSNGAVMEAYDTWLHRDLNLSFKQFKLNVIQNNGQLTFQNNEGTVTADYTTQNGNQIHFRIWSAKNLLGATTSTGAEILSVKFSNPGDFDALGDAGNTNDKFLNGTILNSEQNSGIIQITNPFLGTRITLDMSDVEHPKRISETGDVEQAGFHNEVWVNFNWKGENAGDFFRPFSTLTSAASVVADNGTIKVMPGFTTEKPIFSNHKRYRITAPAGGVVFGTR